MTPYKEIWNTYSKQSFSEKREVVLVALEPLRITQPILETIYVYIYDAPTALTEADLDETYSTILESLYSIDQKEQAEAQKKLQNINDHMIQAREQEIKLHQNEVAEAEWLLGKQLLF